MRSRSLAGRLMLAAFIGIVVATAFGILVSRSFRASLESRQHEELRGAIADISAGLETDAGGVLRVHLDSLDISIYDAMPADAAYVVRNAAGAIVARSDEGQALRALLEARNGSDRIELRSNGKDVVLRTLEGTALHEGRVYSIVAARSERLVIAMDEYAGKLYARGGARTALLALGVFIVVVFLIVRRSLKPLREASDLASKIGPRNLSARLNIEDIPTELVPLLQAFNHALGRLERGYRVQKEFLATAAHELKTPLSLLRSEIELGGAADRETLLRDTALMARQVNQLLHLAEVSEGHNYRFEPASMHVAAFDAADYLMRLSASRGVTLRVDLRGDDRIVEADSGALFVLIKNLLENALHAAPRGGEVRLEVSPAGFVVVDNGRGVPGRQRERLFDRFNRSDDKKSSGAGLGLAICKEICLAHGWDIGLDETHHAGARFVVSIDGKAIEGDRRP